MAALKKRILPYLWITLASAAYALAFNWCYGPGQIAFGGITGVGQILNRFLPWLPVGGAVFLLNLPLFLLGWRLLGGKLLLGSLYAMFVSYNNATAGSGNAAITIMYYIYWMFYDQGKVNYAAAAAILFLIVILLITVIQRVVSKKFIHYV